MSDYDSLYQRSLYLSPDQQDLLYAALASSDQFTKGQNNANFNSVNPDQHRSPPNQNHSQGSSGPEPLDSPPDDVVGSAKLGMGTDDSPFLDFDFDADFDFSGNGSLIGDLPGLSPSVDDADSREKRKSIDDQDDDETGKKRKENDDKMAKKPGRKPLTSEPTTVGGRPVCPAPVYGICSHYFLLSLTIDLLRLYRNERRKTELPSARSAIERKSTSRTLKRRLRTWKMLPRPSTMRIICCARR